MKEGEKERGGEGEKKPRRRVVRRHTDLDVYARSFAAAMKLFELSRKFPMEERYSLTDQCRLSSRSVSANASEAWRKRRYPAALVAKLSDAEGEAAETQTRPQFAVSCGYLEAEVGRPLYAEYDEIIAMLVYVVTHPDDWTF
ncbi:MAG: four helix bundle protein [Opitutia bacterium]|nr:MAG: four helix bundle protein [Opitutae bacterium]